MSRSLNKDQTIQTGEESIQWIEEVRAGVWVDLST